MPEKVNLTEIPNFDLLIFGGRVIDPANGLDGIADVGVRGGVIAAVGADLPRHGAKQLVDATGKLVTPGLIDTHVHVYEGVAPYAFDADEHCLARGSTTVLDCGDAGCNTLEGLKTHVFRRTQCRVLALCHASSTGLSSPDPMGMDPNMGELNDIGFCNVAKSVHVIKSDLASADPFCIGVKIRLSRATTNGGKNEREGFRRALQIAEESGTALMVHHASSTIPVSEVLAQLRPGDMYLLRQTFLLILSPFRSTELFGGAGTPTASTPAPARTRPSHSRTSSSTRLWPRARRASSSTWVTGRGASSGTWQRRLRVQISSRTRCPRICTSHPSTALPTICRPA